MKNLSFLNDKFLDSKIENHNIYGGENKSDVNYADSKGDGNSYDIAVQSLIDVVDSKATLDKPNP